MDPILPLKGIGAVPLRFGLVEESSSSGSGSVEPRRHVSIACEACKRRRRKCSRNHPCESCVRKNIECVFTVHHDGRRKEARKRKTEDLQGDSDMLKDLLESLRGSKEDVDGLVSLIRSDAPDVKELVRQEVQNLRLARLRNSPALESLTEHSGDRKQESPLGSHPISSSRRRALDIARLTDDPPYSICASPWTRVTDDDAMVSNLVSLWITWDRQFYHWIDLDTFLRSIQQGRTKGEYCSSFLVNAILACACPLSDYEEARTRRGVTSDLMSAFFEAAKDLLEESMVNPSIATAQGLALMFQASSMMGRDVLGFEYLQSAAKACKYLERNATLMGESDSTSNGDPLFSRALDTTCWGIFNYITMVQLVYRRPPEMLPPLRPLPPLPQDIVEWSLYPRPGAPKVCFAEQLLHHCSSLSLIVQDVAQLLWGDIQEKPATLTTKVLQLYRRLLHWYDSLPAHLTPQLSSPPSVLLDLCYYHSVVLTLFTPLKQQRVGIQDESASEARAIVRRAALEITRISQLWRSAFGTTHNNISFIQPIYLALHALINDRNSNNYAAEIVELCSFLRAMTRRWPFAMAAFRMIQVTTTQNFGRRLPPGAEALFEEFQNRDWRGKGWLEKESERFNSAFAVLGDGIGDDETRGSRDLNGFFAAMDRVQIDGTTGMEKWKGKAIIR